MATSKTPEPDVDLLPPGATFGDGPGVADEGPIRINFSEEEASSEARDFAPIPAGKYRVRITDGKLEHSKSEKNPGKPMYNLRLDIQEGAYEKRVLFLRVMLWTGAGYTLSQLLQAVTGEKPKPGVEIVVPSIDELIGKELVVSVVRKLDSYAMKPENGYDPAQGQIYKNEVKSIFSADTAVAGASQSTGGSILP